MSRASRSGRRPVDGRLRRCSSARREACESMGREMLDGGEGAIAGSEGWVARRRVGRIEMGIFDGFLGVLFFKIYII